MKITFLTLLLVPVLGWAQKPPAGDTPKKIELPAPPRESEPAGSEEWQSGPPIRIIEVYQDGGSTKFIIQSRQPLVSGRSLYLGLRENAVTIGPLVSRTGGVHYYTASAPGKLRVQPGDSVRFQPTAKLSLPAAVLAALSARHGYEQKAVAEITAVQDDRLMIDKGTLHEVHERDLYRIIDASGTKKGLLEVRGIGDYQSSAIFYNLKGKRGVPSAAQPGDYAVLLGQRRLFGLGLVGGTQFQRPQVLTTAEKPAVGGGLLWSLTFHNGWGIEALFGYYGREGSDRVTTRNVMANEFAEVQDSRQARYLMPVWAKKNFRYPKLISPFIAAGAYLFSGRHLYEVKNSNVGQISADTARKGLYPVVGAGIEFLPARFFRPRVEVRQFFGPTLTTMDNSFRTNATFVSIAVLTSW